MEKRSLENWSDLFKHDRNGMYDAIERAILSYEYYYILFGPRVLYEGQHLIPSYCFDCKQYSNIAKKTYYSNNMFCVACKREESIYNNYYDTSFGRNLKHWIPYMIQGRDSLCHVSNRGYPEERVYFIMKYLEYYEPNLIPKYLETKASVFSFK